MIDEPKVYTNKKLICIQCQEEFIFTAAEQEFFASKNFVEPKRCQKCRQEIRANKLAKGLHND